MIVASVSIDPRTLMQELFNSALAAVDPLSFVPSVLPANPPDRVIVVGAGKAAGAMARAVESVWGDRVSGLVIVRDGYAQVTRTIEVVEASHPVPDERGVAATQRILSLVQTARPDDMLLGLWSGGASALLVQPVAGLTLQQKQAISRALLASGAPIQDLNTVRKHLSMVKGGRLAVAAGERSMLNLIVSDVVGDDPAVIASGPTVADPTTCADALAILKRHEISLPADVEAGLVARTFETPKHLPASIINQIVARPKDALMAAAVHARRRGYEVIDQGDLIEGEAREAASASATAAKKIASQIKKPTLILSGGEVTVTLKAKGGGGPNLEFCLALALALEGHPGIWGLACDTDGTDGASLSAGAIVAPDTLARAQVSGRSAATDLSTHDSEAFFGAIGDLVTPGPTGTNVNDFRAILMIPDYP
jgi:glycerate 2-kinase